MVMNDLNGPWFQARIFNGQVHGPHALGHVRVRADTVVGVAGSAIAHDMPQGPHFAPAGGTFTLNHDCPRAFAEYKSIARLVEGA